jgi:hypothetical protein
VVAAPVVHNIAREAMLQMQIVPDAPGRVDWADHLKAKMEGRTRLGEKSAKRRADDGGGVGNDGENGTL